MNRNASIGLFCVILGILPAVVRGDKQFDSDLIAGDVAAVAVPLAALIYTYHFDDPEGRIQWLENTATTVAATSVLKTAFDGTSWGERPNGGRKSFPSGHTSSACSGAFFLNKRYGWTYGAPALAFALFTGYSRVDEQKHHLRDVIAGCGLAYGVSEYWVTEQTSDVAVEPMLWENGGGVVLHWRF
jgi:membrane-associated phospholipid phosphatase